MEAPVVTLVIPTYKRQADVCRLLELLKQQSIVFKLLVVDQTPGGATPAMRRGLKDLPNARLIEHFPPSLTAARNRALQEVDTPVVVFGDDDITPQPGWIQGMMDAFADPKVGAVAGRVMMAGDPEQVAAPASRLGGILGRGKIAFYSTRSGPCDFAQGCNMAFRTEALKPEGFDERLGGTAHLEDTDASVMVSSKGWSVFFSAEAEVFHHKDPQGGCRADNVATWYHWFAHNHLLFHRKHFLWCWRPAVLLALLIKLARVQMQFSTQPVLWQGIKGLCRGFMHRVD